MQTNIVVTLQVEALHCWPEAKDKIPQMAFLSDLHRHIFHFKVEKIVSHDDRDIEIIQFKRELQDYFNRNYFNSQLNICNFEHRSCEMLCKDLMEAYNLVMVECLEDAENGAVVRK